MISENNDWVGISLKIMAPFTKCVDHCKYFPVEDLIVTFCWIQGLEEVAAWVILSVLISLKEHSSSGNKQSISGNSELSGGVWVAEDQLLEEAIFQCKEGIMACIRPGELDVPLCEINQGASKVRIM
jgi:hypothetical protein